MNYRAGGWRAGGWRAGGWIVSAACLWSGVFLESDIVAADTVVERENVTLADIRAESEKLAAAFSAGKADEVAAMFLPQGELIDEEGTVYQGRKEIQGLLTAFFEKFPGTQVKNEIESVRLVGPVAIEEGTRVTTTKDGSTARVRFISVFAKSDEGWRIASVRDFADESIPSSGEQLKPLGWLIGNWVNEGADARVSIEYRWSEDKNYILGEISVKKNNQVAMKSSQRIGWDPLLGTTRSWMFDSDGGFAEETWTQTKDSWLIRSSTVMPDGQTGSANLVVTPKENGRYVIRGTNRVVGNVWEDDYEITVVKQPPRAAN